MCNPCCIEFVQANLSEQEIRGKSVIEVGSLDVNGSVRPVVEAFGPTSYLGVDIRPGPRVDLICDAGDLAERFGHESFDVLICTEVLEHIRDWRRAISNFKNVLRSSGTLVLTTRSKGFGLHEWPADFWRFEVADLREIFSDFVVEATGQDRLGPGAFVKASKPLVFREKDLTHYSVYSVITGRRVEAITNRDLYWFYARYAIWFRAASGTRRLLSRLLPPSLKRAIRQTLCRGAKP